MILSELRRSEFIMCSELRERFIVFLCDEDQRGCGWIQGEIRLLQRGLHICHTKKDCPVETALFPCGI